MNSDEEVTKAVKEIWDISVEDYTIQRFSHYRGIGQWEDDKLWLDIGNNSLAVVNHMLGVYGQGTDFWTKPRNVLEWGPGGGSNPFAFRHFVKKYYGVDISQANLDETERVLLNENSDMFHKIYIKKFISEVKDAVLEPIDVFISTAVFQHFPTKQYGIDCLSCVHDLLKDNGVGFVQIRYDNGNPKFKSNKDIGEYKSRYITANSYAIEEFYDILTKLGFRDIFIKDIFSKINYATFCFRK